MNNRQVAMTLRGLAGRRRPSRPPTRAGMPMRRARTREEFEGAEGGAAAGPVPAGGNIDLRSANRWHGPVAARPLPAERVRRVVLPEAEADPGQQILRNVLIFGGVGLVALAAA